jgi:hypothetical protein
MQTAPRHMFLLCIKSAPVLFFARFGVCSFSPVPFEINRAIMRLARRQSFIKKRTTKENAIKERVAREFRVPNWRTVMDNNKYRADNLAAIANLIISKDQVFFDDDNNNKFGAAPSKLISNQPLPFSRLQSYCSMAVSR